MAHATQTTPPVPQFLLTVPDWQAVCCALQQPVEQDSGVQVHFAAMQ